MIFFDIDGTLLDHDLAVRRAVAEFFHNYSSDVDVSSEEDFQQLWKTTSESFMDKYLAGEMTFAEQRRARVRALGRESFAALSDADVDAIFAFFLEAYERNFCVYDDVPEVLEWCRSRGSVGVISNGDGEQQRKKLRDTGLDDYFSVCVISGEVGASKPDEAIFQAAERGSGAGLSNLWYVGDRRETDALGAVGAGWKGVWLNRNSSERAPDPVITIHSLLELSTIVSNS